MDSSMIESDFAAGMDSGVSLVAVKAKAAPAKKATVAPKAKAAPKKAAASITTKAKPKAAATKKRAKPDSDDEDEGVGGLSAHDDSLLSATPPSAKKQKKAPPKKKTGGEPLRDLINEAVSYDGPSDTRPKMNSATEQYQKLTQLEHIIKRPDTYIGSVERSEKQMWVYNTELDTMEMREVSFVPGLYKIFDEIVVNAADNKQRDKNMDAIKITVDREKGEISVMNNGRGIPIQIHEKEKIYIPEMIFGHLLTSSNYDDEEQKVTGGRNGYGAKLCNVFSTKFTLETADAKAKLKYKQTWTANMSKMGAASITPNKGEDFTKITFTPDFQKFRMDGIDDDFEALVKRRVYDLAGTIKGVKVWLNGEKIKVTNFKKYMELYTKAIKRERGDEAQNDTSDIITDAPNERWEIGFAVSDGTFQQVSFVNSIATTSGGTHVNYIADQVCTKLLEIVRKKNKGGAQLKLAQIRNHIFLFVNCLIVNPAFTSQTKEQLTTKQSQFGSKCVVSDEFLKKIAKTEVVANILHFAEQKADQILKKSDGNKRSRMDNPKLTDANKAGTKDGYQCTLILTEGDSAKGLAMAGRAVVGPDLFGVFPLRGKLLNVRDASVDQVSKNAEIQNIKNIIGLKHKQTYMDCKSLRYGHIMIMTDQDYDGSHIKGLLINFLQVTFPSLLKIPKFLIEFITPIVKVYKGNQKQPTKLHSFFSMPEYETWKEDHKHEKGWEHKYFKGLGTSTTEEAQTYFKDLDRHLKEFHTMQDQEVELIELAFSKKKADERKEWLRQFKPGTYLDHTTQSITYTDFVNKELILFSMADNLRSIPSMVDGFKPGQRKVLFACFKKNLKKDMKVVELAGYVGGQTAYHHGDVSLQQTIVGLAQTFVGSNNVNCLEPSGNFGSRLQGGSDAASARYIFTRLSPFARRIFHPADEPLLRYNTDDGRPIEPEHYVPVVPMILINGADGIGTGWSSSIPNYNPEDIVENLKLMMDGHEPKPMSPWFRDFQGRVVPMGPDRYKFTGIARQVSDTQVEVTELPIRMWTQDFKERLVEIIKAEKTPSWIKDYDDYNTHKQVHFVIRLDEKHMEAALTEGLEEKLKLTRSIATSNLVAFDAEGRITKYNSVEDILKEFFGIRLKFYEKRKAYQLNEFNEQLQKLTNQARFVQMIIDHKLVITKKKKKDLVEELRSLNFKPIAKHGDAHNEGETESFVENEDETNDEATDMAANSYDYLLGLPLWSLTKERVEKLLRQIGDKEMEIDVLIKLSREDLWKRDLNDFINEWRYQLEDDAKIQKTLRNSGRRLSSKIKTQGKSGKPAPKKRKNLLDSTSSSSEFEAKKKVPKIVAPIPGSIASFLPASKPSTTAKQQSSILEAFANSKKTVEKADPVKEEASARADENMMMLDGTVEDLKTAIVPKPRGRIKAAAAKAPKPTKSKPINVDSDFDEEEIEEVVRNPPAAAPGRAPRAAARRAVKYSAGLSDDDDSDDGDDMLLDVGQMVKGIGSSATVINENTRPLFSVTATLSRPGSSGGLIGRKSAARSVLDDNEDFGADDTDYTRLAPSTTGNGRGLTAKSTILSDDEEDSFEAGLVAKASYSKPAPVVAKAKANGVKTAAAKAAPAKKAVVEKKEPAKPKQITLSPAAKAYAKKLAASGDKQTMKLATKKPTPDSEDEEDDDDKIVDDLLSDDTDEDEPLVTRRPARRAAAAAPKAKAKYTFDSEEDEEDEPEEESDEFDESD